MGAIRLCGRDKRLLPVALIGALGQKARRLRPKKSEKLPEKVAAGDLHPALPARATTMPAEAPAFAVFERR
jgi:hypothetical protein